ncbi:MAG: hypothetical protein FJ257_12290 [Phycisphaerae bacterium]|nr:hypothetical protein [Phycisphaerae bacterium]
MMPTDPRPRPDDDAPPPGAVMSFGEHLEELRRRVILALIIPLPLAVVAFVFADSIRDVLTRPLYDALEAQALPTQVQALSPIEAITTDLFLSVIVALVLSAPWLVFQLWRFVEPGLYLHERRFARFLMPASATLVVIGLAVFYWIMLPLMLLFLVGFGQHDPTEVYPTSPAQVADAPRSPAATETAPSDPGAREPTEPRDATATATHATSTEPKDAPSPTSGGSADVSTSAPRPASLPILSEVPNELHAGDAWIDARTAQIRVVVPLEGGGVEIRSAALARDRSVLPSFRLREYVDFVLLVALAMAIAFQMPLVILLLGWVGIVRVETLRRNRGYALLGLTVLAAVMTPPDFVSMMLLLVPLYGLYELGIVLLVLMPPERIAEGSVMRGALDRMRRWRRKPATAAAVPAASAEPPPRGTVPRGAREPDGDADEPMHPPEHPGDGPGGAGSGGGGGDAGRPWP